MKRIVLKRLTLRNFKGIRDFTVEFSGGETQILGANATGKSTLRDAFTWVLFGKDAAGNSDTKFGIKTNGPDGRAIPKLEHGVIAVLDVAGQTVELRRCYCEDWVTPRGSAEPVLRGHTTGYFHNGVPLKEGEYRSKTDAIIEEQLFRMLTGPFHFAGLDWSARREVLLRIAGGVTLEEAAAGRAEFAALLAQLSGKDLNEFKAQTAARKKKISEALDSIPARLDEVDRATPAAPDYAALEAEKTAVEKSIETVEAAMQNAAELARAEYEAQAEIQRQINAQKGIRQETLFRARQEAAKTAYEKNAARIEAEAKRNALQKELDSLTAATGRDIELSNAGIRKNLLRIGDLKRKVQTLREQWEAENGKEYSGSDSCRTCGQLLPEDRRAEKRTLFEASKSSELKRIFDEGTGLNKTVQSLEEDSERIKKYVDEEKAKLEKRQAEASAEIQDLENTVNSHPAVEADAEIRGEDLPEWNEAQKQIDTLSERLEALVPKVPDGPKVPGDTREFAAKKKELTGQLDAIRQQLGLKTVIEAGAGRRAELLK
jgi:DNA repair exonuclease SbcCD ATPase subunit